MCPTGAVAFRFFMTIGWQFRTNRAEVGNDTILYLKRKIIKTALGLQ
jgi:hypothetical protein